MKTAFILSRSVRLGLVLVLFVGAISLIVTGTARADFVYVVQPGDSLARIAVRHQTTIEALIAINQSTYPCLATVPSCLQIGWTLTIPGSQTPTASGTYIVQSGDSLSKIAQRHHLTVDAIVQANKTQYPCLVKKPQCLQTGWVIVLPGGGQFAAAPTPTTVGLTMPSEADLDARLAVGNEVNRVRLENGLAALAWENRVAGLAQIRSSDMATRNYLSHFDPETGALLSAQLMRPAGYSTGCENLYSSSGRALNELPAVSVGMWMSSSGHRACVLNSGYRLMGAGVAQGSDGKWYVTLLITK